MDCFRRSVVALGLLVQLVVCVGCTRPVESSFVIVNARIVDGAGAPSYMGAVRIRNGEIVGVGQILPALNDRAFDAGGLTLTPGFIDTHSHHDEDIDRQPEALAAISQGITTIVVGQDGDSALPLAGFFDKHGVRPTALNIASYTGHGTLRSAVMGDDYKRVATAQEIEQMARLLEIDMKAGSLGLSSGLEYDPGIYSTHAEVVELAKVSAAYGGRYISHMRSEDVALDAAIDELLAIGRDAKIPVQISHFKLAITDRWGHAGEILAKLDAARKNGIEVSADVYPYAFWQSDLTVLFPQRDFTDIKAAEFALTHLSTPEGMLISGYEPDPSLVGQTIADIAVMRGTSPAQTYLDLINKAAETEATHSVIGTSMDPDDIATLIAWPHSNISSDGALVDRHPRGAGTFTRVLGRYVREDGHLSITDAISKMTYMSAQHVGITDRGLIAKGMAADLVLFDPETVIDRATTVQPDLLSMGIERVWVNGQLVFSEGAATGKLPGKILRRDQD